MAFSREDLATYEQQPQTVVDDKASPFDGATPAKQATAADAAAAQAAKQAAKEPAVDDANPSGAVESDPDVQGGGASDVNADPSTASADPSGESDPEGGAADDVVPAKGSAAERIQEINDLMHGYKEFGRLKESENAALRAELARLTAGAKSSDAASPAPTAATKPVVARMPRIEDPNINFDTDKLEAAMEDWVNNRIDTGVETKLKAVTGQTEVEQIRSNFETRATKFAETHKDWETVVAKNPVLLANQLAPKAALALARSDIGPEVMYYMGQNPGLAVRIAKLHPDQQLEELGELKATVKANKAATTTTANPKPGNGPQVPANGAKTVQKKTPTQAPPPPNPTRAANRSDPRDETDPNMGMDEFAKLHRSRRQQARQDNRKSRGLA